MRFIVILAALLCGREGLGSTHPKDWLEREESVTRFLWTAEIVADEEVGRGVTQPRKVTLEQDGVILRAIWKPVRKGRRDGIWESHQAEAAAYNIDKLLGLDMVPPTVIREVGETTGSLQLWVEGVSQFAEISPGRRPEKKWRRERSRMLLFDNLICNPDRNARNYFVTSDWSIILIDHSQAFATRSPFYRDGSLCLATGESSVALPDFFDRELVERLRRLDAEALEATVGDLLSRNQIDSLLERRDALLKYIEKLVEEKGGGAVWF